MAALGAGIVCSPVPLWGLNRSAAVRLLVHGYVQTMVAMRVASRLPIQSPPRTADFQRPTHEVGSGRCVGETSHPAHRD